MPSLKIRFYAQLNLFLPAGRRQQVLDYDFKGRPSVKNVIESLGVPHPEVDYILINDRAADFTCQVSGGERVAAYPHFYSPELKMACPLRPAWQGDCRFILDNHLGKLAALLRMVGFDAAYDHTWDDGQLAALSVAQDRILLTRDRALLMRGKVVHACHIWSLDPKTQLAEVLQRYDLQDQLQLFTRCLICNTRLDSIREEEVLASLPEKLRGVFHTFKTCPTCGRIYWKGVHYENMLAFVDRLRAGLSGIPPARPDTSDPFH